MSAGFDAIAAKARAGPVPLPERVGCATKVTELASFYFLDSS
jgi:hypothetical protein